MNKVFKILFLIVVNSLLILNHAPSEENKIKIGLLVPLTGDNAELGKQILNSVRLAIKDIDVENIQIYPKDTNSDPKKTLHSAIELSQMGINLIIGPVFYDNLLYLDEVKNITFLSLTNKTLKIPNNVVSAGINSISQLNTIKKFIKQNEIKKTIFLIPNLSYDLEIINGIKNSKIRIYKEYSYDIDPTKLTKQIEKITNYKIRQQNLYDEIKRVENSDDPNKEKKIENLKKKYTIGNLDFDSIVIADFSESLKSVITSLLYTDVSPKDKYFITFNQWFDDSLLTEKNSQPLYFPSININNLIEFEKKFENQFNQKPNHLSLLSYDLVGLIYYLSLSSDFSNISSLFKKENSFKGKIGIFDIKNNKINHRLNFYKLENGVIEEIF